MAPPPNSLMQVGQIAQRARWRTPVPTLAKADDAELANAQNHTNYILGGLSTALARGDRITKNELMTMGANLVAETKGRVSAQEIANWVMPLPDSGPELHAALKSSTRCAWQGRADAHVEQD